MTQHADTVQLQRWLAETPDTKRVAHFVAGPGIQKLEIGFDINLLKQALDALLQSTSFQGDMQTEGFGAIGLTRQPGDDSVSANDLSGRYWLRADERYVEEAREDIVDEARFSEFIPDFKDNYFAEVHRQLCERFTIGRMRVLSKGLYNCNSWHRDPEPRLHIPIISNPGSLFVVNNHCTHLPADGSVYFTDTRGYHMAMNGGLRHRVHLVAALPL
ncbi:MAG: hypothetical protein ACI8P9_002881 [Parasphingorhabdus sp.]|jgi:hypothetical protein